MFYRNLFKNRFRYKYRSSRLEKSNLSILTRRAHDDNIDAHPIHFLA